MRTNKMHIFFGVFVIASMFFIAGCSNAKKVDEEKHTIGDIAYDNYISSGFFSKIGLVKDEIDEKDYTVYIKENDKFVPYLVLTSNYNGNTLLLRKYVLEKEYPFALESFEKNYNDSSKDWNLNRIYYENSSIDKFLNDEYIRTLDSYIQDSIVNTSILVTKGRTTGNGFKMDIYPIERKVFLISCTEIGMENKILAPEEGEPLKYFNNKERYLAYAHEGERERVWYLRTPYFGESVDGVWVSGMDGVLGFKGIADWGEPDGLAKSSVRPSFCVNNLLPIEESVEVIEGETVYVLKR